jgi:Flp pilus assembly protein TadD
LELERYQTAADMFNDLYKTNQRDERILMGRAVALQKLGRDEEAIRAYDELIALNPNNPDVMINALGLVRKQNPTEALSRLLNLRQKYPTNPTIAAQIGLVNAELGNFDEGLRYLNIAADIESTNPRHFFNMAVIGERMKRPDLAVRYYEQALKADALSGNVRNRMDRDMVYDRLSIVRQQMR